jgi:hypothetical protein
MLNQYCFLVAISFNCTLQPACLATVHPGAGVPLGRDRPAEKRAGLEVPTEVLRTPMRSLASGFPRRALESVGEAPLAIGGLPFDVDEQRERMVTV